ncbi:MAG: methyltransferase domain-containing protein [Candidatus Cloacimonetes bacterium]|nr:methyltransferase domain-containing protein [Candidatus Cloacimonadota bacterium]
MAIPIINNWEQYFFNPDEGLGSSYERIIINNKLLQIAKLFNIKSVLEAPSFGFTGISGINSFALKQNSINVHLLDHNRSRIKLIKKTWQDLKENVDIDFTTDYMELSYPDKQFNLVWNFSALWFVDDLQIFLEEFTRICNKVVLICVPNQTGLGFLSQKYSGKKEMEKINIDNIAPSKIIKIMRSLNWTLLQQNYIDCPPWPDIGMPKEKFLRQFGLSKLISDKPKESISILDYYSMKNMQFPEQMMKYSWFERIAPDFIKQFWAHHKYLLFIPNPRKQKQRN